jgi:3-phenylpropionate/cinnamic acid dioxygenase small subunit
MTEAEDKAAVEDVLVRYATGIDRRDWELFRTCFTPDCRTDYGPIGAWRGVDAITDWMAAAHVPFGLTLHRMTNFAVALERDRATSRCYVHVILTLAEQPDRAHEAFGFYDDVLLRDPDRGGWMIDERRFTTVLSKPPA